MFDVNNINLHFGARHVLRDATFKVSDGERAAIIGPNGAGKSTLLKVIAGQISSEGGSVTYPNDSQIGYLPQELTLNSTTTVEEECRKVFQELLDHEQEMRDIEHRMSEMPDHTSDEFDKLSHRYDYLMHETMRRDIYSMDATIGRVLGGLGFKPEDAKRLCSEFSGGWQMRIALARILLANPDILLLDEPTNHLDIESIEWLGDWLSNHEGSILMVSHERSFMDKLVNKVVEIDRGKVVIYRGNYTKSLNLREERREQQKRSFDNQQQQIAQTQRFIDRFRAKATKASVVQSRVKMLEKMDIVEEPESDLGTIHFNFPPAPRSGKEVIVAQDLSKSFGTKQVFHGVDLTLYRGEKVALVGVNGAGKSTLMKILAGKLKQDTGTCTFGSSVEMQYFAQYEYEDLHMANTVLGEFQSIAPLQVSARARDILGAFLFSGDDVEKKISMLSGGEKTRLRLAKMLSGAANLLLMDEPTNHLDVGSRVTLEEALKQYDGAVVLVSHDRYFLDNVVTRVIEIAEGEAHSYPGNYTEYLYLKGKAEARANAGAAEAPKATKQTGGKERSQDQIDRNKLQKDLRNARKRVEELESKVAEADELVRNLENELAKPANATNAEKASKLAWELKKQQTALQAVENQWTEAQVAVEELEGQLGEE